jgi:urease gamma subunit
MVLNNNTLSLIDAKVTVKGEPDAQPLIKHFHFDGEISLKILSNSAKKISDKLSRGAKINVNEVLLTYLNYIIFALKSNTNVSEMEVHVSKLLGNNQVMIGVPETLREIRINIIGDDIPENQIVLNEPIPTPRYDICDTK